MFQTPHPKFRSYDAADAELDDPAEIKFSDDEEEAEFLRREAATGKGRAGAGVAVPRSGQLRVDPPERRFALHPPPIIITTGALVPPLAASGSSIVADSQV